VTPWQWRAISTDLHCLRHRIYPSGVNLSLYRRDVDGVAVIRPKGRIVFGDETEHLRSSVKEILVTEGLPVVIDLAEVSYVDSGGVGCLVGLFTTAKAAGRTVQFAGANDKVKHVLTITRLLPVIGMHDDQTAAVRASQSVAAS